MTAPRAPASRAEVVEVIHDTILAHPTHGRSVAHAVLAVLESAGVWLVPAEATEEMRQAGGISPTRYCFLMDASPYAPEGGV